MANSIRHSGTVQAIESGHVQVRIIQMTACASCKLASSCHTSEMKEKIINAMPPAGRDLKVGDVVTVLASKTTAGLALLMAFGLPLMLMLVLLVVMLTAGVSEVVTAFVMLTSLIPYYIIIWCMRKRIASRLIFWIE